MQNITRVVGRLDAVNLMREQSRERFASMPKQQRIGNKKRKQPRYKQDWRRDGF